MSRGRTNIHTRVLEGRSLRTSYEDRFADWKRARCQGEWETSINCNKFKFYHFSNFSCFCFTLRVFEREREKKKARKLSGNAHPDELRGAFIEQPVSLLRL